MKNREIKGSVGILSLFKSAGDDFYAIKHEYRFLEISDEQDADDKFEFQVGFGYKLTTKQANANGSGIGAISGIPFDLKSSYDNFLFSVDIIGIGVKGDLPQASPNIYASIPTNLEITPTAFIAAAGSVSKATGDFYGALADSGQLAPYANYRLCPQVMAVRYKRKYFEKIRDELKAKGKTIGRNTILEQDQIALKDRLATVNFPCEAALPNAVMVFSGGQGDLNLEFAANAGGKGQNVYQRYARRKLYLTSSNEDRYILTVIQGLNTSVATTSLLSVMITASTSKTASSIFYYDRGLVGSALVPAPVAVSGTAEGADLFSNLAAVYSAFVTKKELVDKAANR